MAASCNGQQQKIYYVGIAGVTCGGKSTLADKLKTNLSDVAEVTIVHQDDFYVTKDRLPPLPALNYWNFDIPEAIEWERLINALPTASDKTTVVIIEGNIIFANDKIGKMCHQRYFIHASYDLIKAVRSSRNYDPPDVPGYFDQIAWPLYLQSKKDAEATGLPIIFLDAQNYETNCHQIHVDVCRQIIDDWVIISDQPISSQKAIDFVTSSCCGAISLFIGKVPLFKITLLAPSHLQFV